MAGWKELVFDPDQIIADRKRISDIGKSTFEGRPLNSRMRGSIAAKNENEVNQRTWLDPGQKNLRRAAELSVIGSLFWPVQAALRALIGQVAEAQGQDAAETSVDRARIVLAVAARVEESPFGGALLSGHMRLSPCLVPGKNDSTLKNRLI